MKEIINFSSKFSKMEMVNPLITKYRINICQADIPANKYVFSKPIIDGMSTTICGSGVYTYYFEKFDQLGGHTDDYIKTPYGYTRTPETKAYGFSDPYKMPYWENIDGEDWFCADVFIWTGTNPEVEDILNNGVVWQSMQVAVDEEEDSNGNKIVKDAVFLGFCLLQGIDPAFTGSTITKFSLNELGSKIDSLSSELNQLKQEYESIINLSNNARDFTKEEGEDLIKEAVEKFSLNSNQIREILNNFLSQFKYKPGDYEWNKYWVNCYDETYVYVDDEEDYKTYRMTYNITDNVATVDIDSKEEVIRGGYVPVGSESEQETANLSEDEEGKEKDSEDVQLSEDEETKEEQEDNKEEVNESSNANVDSVAMEQLNEQAAENNEQLANENLEVQDDSANIIAGLKADMAKMQEDLDVYMAENATLKEFKKNIEDQNKEFAVETTLKEVSESLPPDELEACRTSAQEFSLENIDAWKNEVKARAFNFSRGIKEKKPFIVAAFPNTDTPKKHSGLWD